MFSELFGLVQHAGGFPLRQATLDRQPRTCRGTGSAHRLLGGISRRQQQAADGGQPRGQRACPLGTREPLTTRSLRGAEPVEDPSIASKARVAGDV
jgi:hypothetical protein